MTSIDNLSSQINQALQTYGTTVREEVLNIAKEVTNQAVDELKTAGKFKNRTGDYRKGWETIRRGRNYIVRNRTDYQLTHLLEKGHAKRNGGRVKKFVHIKPVEVETIKNFEKELRERL